MEMEIYKYVEAIYFQVQRTNMAENKWRNSRKGLFLFLKRRFSES